jgi:hypothetical protein
MISEIFARSGAALPGLCDAIRSYRPELVVRETAEFGAALAADRTSEDHRHMRA